MSNTTENNDTSDVPAIPLIPPTPPIPPVPPVAYADAASPQPLQPALPGGRLSLAALIVGIVAIVSAVIPGLSFVAFIPAFAAVILGIMALVKRSRGKGRAIAGIAIGAAAFFVAVIVSIFTIVAGLSPSIIDEISSAAEEAAATSEPVLPDTDADTDENESAEPTADPDTSGDVPADISYSGTGDTVLPIELPDGTDSIAFATITHTGSENFAVWSLDAEMAEQSLLVNTIGTYTGTVAFDLTEDETSSALEITADGSWTVVLHSFGTLPEFTDGSASGTGDTVLRYDGDAGVATLTHTGESNFVVQTFGETSDLVVNEIGDFSGSAAWEAGTSAVMITADGAWTIIVR